MFVRRPMLYIFDAFIWNFEALGFGKDGVHRKHMPRMLPLIKNENEGITNNLILIFSHKPYRLQLLMINWKLFLRSCNFFNISQILLN